MCDSAVFNEREASSEGLVLGAGSGAGVGTRRGRVPRPGGGAATARRTGKVRPLQPGGRGGRGAGAYFTETSVQYSEPLQLACIMGEKIDCLRSDAWAGRTLARRGARFPMGLI